MYNHPQCFTLNFFEEAKMVYINADKVASLAQGVLKRPFKIQSVNQIITSTPVSRYPKKTTGSTTIADNHTQSSTCFSPSMFIIL